MLRRLPAGASVVDWVSWLTDRIPLVKSTLGDVIGLGLLCLALAIFYTSAARARIAFRSAVVGGALSAVMLAVVLWAFTRLQIGVSRAGALQSGMAAIPVFLLWAHASWLVILLGAQIAIAHELDGILIHGTSALQPRPLRRAGGGAADHGRDHAARPVVAGRRPVDDGRGGTATANELARELRLLPDNVREVAGRLQSGGLASPGRIRRVSPGVRSRRDGLARRRRRDHRRSGRQTVGGAAAAGTELA